MVDLNTHPTVSEWLTGIRIAHRGHIEAAKAATGKHRTLGTLAALLGAISATAVFSNLRDNPQQWVQVLAGALVLATVSLVAINTFLNHSGRASAHMSASTGYGELRRELEQRLMTSTVDDDFLTHVRTTWTRLDREAPTIPHKIFDSVFTQVKGVPPTPKKKRWWSRG